LTKQASKPKNESFQKDKSSSTFTNKILEIQEIENIDKTAPKPPKVIQVEEISLNELVKGTQLELNKDPDPVGQIAQMVANDSPEFELEEEEYFEEDSSEDLALYKENSTNNSPPIIRPMLIENN